MSEDVNCALRSHCSGSDRDVQSRDIVTVHVHLTHPVVKELVGFSRVYRVLMKKH